MPKLTTEATASHLLSLWARASARAFGIFSGGLGFPLPGCGLWFCRTGGRIWPLRALAYLPS
ncbi:MAG: hypothetical protein ACJ8CB_26775 [Ktedonobacteraceae bacterium]